MNQILYWLRGGDLRSDGMSTEVAEFVLKHPELIEELCAGLKMSDDIVRGRTADALEKIARKRPVLVRDRLSSLINLGKTDLVMMVRMHVAMILGHLAIYRRLIPDLRAAAIEMLTDGSPFVVSWALVTLCILARESSEERPQIQTAVAALQEHTSAAVQSKVNKALRLLSDESLDFPGGWIKSSHLKAGSQQIRQGHAPNSIKSHDARRYRRGNSKAIRKGK